MIFPRSHVFRSDIRLIQLQYKVGRYLGFNPNPNYDVSLAFKVYFLIFYLVVICVTALGYAMRFEDYIDGIFIETIMDAGQSFLELVIVSVCLKMGTFRKSRSHWKKLFEYIELSENAMNQDNLTVEINLVMVKLRIFLYHLAHVLVQLYENYIWMINDQLSQVLAYLSFRISFYYQFFTVLYLCNFSQMLERRYNHISKVICDTLKMRTLSVVGSKDDDEVVYKLRSIAVAYRHLYNIVEEINVIFGWHMLLYSLSIILSLLIVADFALYSLRDLQMGYKVEKTIVYIILYPSLYIASVSALAMSCNRAEESSNNVVTTCVLGLEGLENSPLREELVVLVNYTKKLRAKFSAAGFFLVNQQLLPTLFSSITTYLIIVIQFNFSFTQNEKKDS